MSTKSRVIDYISEMEYTENVDEMESQEGIRGGLLGTTVGDAVDQLAFKYKDEEGGVHRRVSGTVV